MHNRSAEVTVSARHRAAMNPVAVIAAAAIMLGLCACAHDVQPLDTQDDPLQPLNHAIFESNQTFDRTIFRPTAVFYTDFVPEPARDGMHNVLMNFRLPVTFANDLLQADVERGGETLARFAVNTTLGLGGLVDTAGKMQMPGHEADFGETLALYGVGEGPYLVLPILGPSNARDAVGIVADAFLDPLTYVTFRSSTFFELGRSGATALDARARNIDTLDEIEQSSVDLYATMRSLYRQHRRSQINRGKTDVRDLPDF